MARHASVGRPPAVSFSAARRVSPRPALHSWSGAERDHLALIFRRPEQPFGAGNPWPVWPASREGSTLGDVEEWPAGPRATGLRRSIVAAGMQRGSALVPPNLRPCSTTTFRATSLLRRRTGVDSTPSLMTATSARNLPLTPRVRRGSLGVGARRAHPAIPSAYPSDRIVSPCSGLGADGLIRSGTRQGGARERRTSHLRTAGDRASALRSRRPRLRRVLSGTSTEGGVMESGPRSWPRRHWRLVRQPASLPLSFAFPARPAPSHARSAQARRSDGGAVVG